MATKKRASKRPAAAGKSIEPRASDAFRLSKASLEEMLRPHVKVEVNSEYSLKGVASESPEGEAAGWNWNFAKTPAAPEQHRTWEETPAPYRIGYSSVAQVPAHTVFLPARSEGCSIP